MIFSRFHPRCILDFDPGVRQGAEVLKADITIGDEQYEIQYPTDVSLHRAILYLFRDHSTQDRLMALHYCGYDEDEADSFVRSGWLKGVPLSRTQKDTLIIISRKTLSKRKGESLSAEDLHKKQRQSYKAGFVHATKSFSSALQVAGPAILGAASPSMAANSGVREYNESLTARLRTAHVRELHKAQSYHL